MIPKADNGLVVLDVVLLARRGLGDNVIEGLPLLGISGICNVLAAIRTARTHLAGNVDGSAIQQHFFRQRRFARIRV